MLLIYNGQQISTELKHLNNVWKISQIFRDMKCGTGTIGKVLESKQWMLPMPTQKL